MSRVPIGVALFSDRGFQRSSPDAWSRYSREMTYPFDSISGVRHPDASNMLQMVLGPSCRREYREPQDFRGDDRETESPEQGSVVVVQLALRCGATFADVLDQLDPKEACQVLEWLRADVVAVCAHKNGSQAVMAILHAATRRDTLSGPEEGLLSSILGAFSKLVFDSHGHRVLAALACCDSKAVRDCVAEIVIQLKHGLLEMCLDEVGSMVVAAVLRGCSQQHRSVLGAVLMREDVSTLAYDAPSLDVLELLLDQEELRPKIVEKLQAQPEALAEREDGSALSAALGISL